MSRSAKGPGVQYDLHAWLHQAGRSNDAVTGNRCRAIEFLYEIDGLKSKTLCFFCAEPWIARAWGGVGGELCSGFGLPGLGAGLAGCEPFGDLLASPVGLAGGQRLRDHREVVVQGCPQDRARCIRCRASPSSAREQPKLRRTKPGRPNSAPSERPTPFCSNKRAGRLIPVWRRSSQAR